MSISNQCLDCKHYTGLCTCKAFPDKIPEEIFTGLMIHDKPYEGDAGIMYDPIDTELSADKMLDVIKILDDKGLLSKFEIPDEILEEAGIDIKKMSPDQLKAMFAMLKEKGLLNDKPTDKKSTGKESTTKEPEGAQGSGKPGLVKKKVTVKRNGKSSEEYRWVKAGEDEPVDKPKKGEDEQEEKPVVKPEPEKPKGPVIMGLNSPKGEDEVDDTDEKTPETSETPETSAGGEDTDVKTTKTEMTKENVESIKSLNDMKVLGGINEEFTNIVSFKGGSKGVYKTTDISSTQGEVNVQDIQSILGWDIAPETVVDDFGYGEGSCQKFISNTVEIEYGRSFKDSGAKKIEEKHYNDCAKIFLMDLISGNYDRHGNNVMLDKKDKVWAIDNDTWGNKSKYSPEINKDFYNCYMNNWMSLKDEEQRNTFQVCVDKHIDEIIDHKREIIDHFDNLRKNDEKFAAENEKHFEESFEDIDIEGMTEEEIIAAKEEYRTYDYDPPMSLAIRVQNVRDNINTISDYKEGKNNA